MPKPPLYILHKKYLWPWISLVALIAMLAYASTAMQPKKTKPAWFFKPTIVNIYAPTNAHAIATALQQIGMPNLHINTLQHNQTQLPAGALVVAQTQNPAQYATRKALIKKALQQKQPLLALQNAMPALNSLLGGRNGTLQQVTKTPSAKHVHRQLNKTTNTKIVIAEHKALFWLTQTPKGNVPICADSFAIEPPKGFELQAIANDDAAHAIAPTANTFKNTFILGLQYNPTLLPHNSAFVYPVFFQFLKHAQTYNANTN